MSQVIIHPAVASHQGETLEEIAWLSEERRKALLHVSSELELERLLRQRAEANARRYEYAAAFGFLLAIEPVYRLLVEVGDWLLG